MYRSKVDTDLLKQKAKRLTELSLLLDQAGKELLLRSNNVPSYGGQLLTPANRAGVLAQHDANTLRELTSGGDLP
jgi:hypothetical protein